MKFPYPILFKPVYQHYIWGGDRIPRRFNRDEPPGVYAESWEVSDRPEGMSVAINGACAGMSLPDLLRDHGPDILGADTPADTFPLLIKLIDARETLSVQVHPDDAHAARHGGEAKTEMWYVLEADPDACVYAGLKPGVTEKAFRDAMNQQSLKDLLNVLPVSAGDAIFMPGGRVHAIGAGCLLLEVQQNSNTTWRIYDWGRVGLDGKGRELHIEQAIQVIRWRNDGEAKVTPRRLGHIERNELWEILACPYFRMERLLIREPWPAGNDGRSFHVLFCARGTAAVACPEGDVELSTGATCLIPAALARYEIIPGGDEATVIRLTRPPTI